MTEKDKRQKGLLYDANYNEEIVNDLEKAKDICYEYNKLKPSDTENQKMIMSKLLGRAGEGLRIVAPFYCDFGYNIEMGENFYANHNCVILDGAKVTFGDNVFIGPNCCFSTAGHPIDSEERNSGYEFAYPITVGNNCWFGAGVTVLPGITIGDDVVIGAGSIVTKDIPSGVIAVGNPCKVMRKITEEDKMLYSEDIE